VEPTLLAGQWDELAIHDREWEGAPVRFLALLLLQVLALRLWDTQARKPKFVCPPERRQASIQKRVVQGKSWKQQNSLLFLLEAIKKTKARKASLNSS
jgi:hypothetical protein